MASGDPQGSRLGPVLFDVFVYEIGSGFLFEFLLYADDLKIFRSIRGFDDTASLQHGIDEPQKWCQNNKLKLNIEKCLVISF